MKNRYLLLLSNNYSNKKWCFELFNRSCDNSMYIFEDFGQIIPDDFDYGLYDYALLHCAIPYEVEFNSVLLDSVIHTLGGDFLLRDLSPETGMLEFKPDENGSPYGVCDKIDVRNYDSIP